MAASLTGPASYIRYSSGQEFMRARPKRYKGFVVTPHSAQIEDRQAGARLWTVAAFLRTEKQSPDLNKYFQQRGVFVSTKAEALERGVSYGKRLVDEELVTFVRQHNRRRTPERIYRRAHSTLSWHFCERCSFWPTQDYEERARRPASDQLCNECIARSSCAAC